VTAVTTAELAPTPAAALLAALARRDQIAARLLIVVAHPDDETIAAGAQLCRWADALLVHVTNGAPRDGIDAAAHGFAGIEDYAAGRRFELGAALRAGEAARLRTAEFGIPDKTAYLALVEITRRIAGLISAEHPAAILVHAYEGGHPDHDAAAFAVHAACDLTAAADRPAIIEVPLYHALGGRFSTGQFLPDEAVDACQPFGRTGSDAVGVLAGETVLALGPEEQDRKRRMIDCFTSQRQLLAGFGTGSERFRAAPRYDFGKPPHLGALNYEGLGWDITGAEWRRCAVAALAALGLDRGPCR